MQFAAYYNPSGELVLARDRDAGTWEYEWTPYRGNVVDAHNSISIAVDGDGYLHVAWSHHNSPLRYARSVAPGSLELGRERSMISPYDQESVVTYPEFFRLPDGDLFFLYRDGASGNGNVVLSPALPGLLPAAGLHRLARLDEHVPLPPKAIWNVSPVPPRTIDRMPPVSIRTSMETPAVQSTTACAVPEVGRSRRRAQPDRPWW
ncbi:BNR-4 repeat-containing protein [Georgenia sp. SUBG003]|uniref:BNR-4 repeat-containing protein n=1 Tax=Georgenia sp. SUBG003 TaxID=1497974 RepID=UPI003AB5639F